MGNSKSVPHMNGNADYSFTNGNGHARLSKKQLKKLEKLKKKQAAKEKKLLKSGKKVKERQLHKHEEGDREEEKEQQQPVIEQEDHIEEPPSKHQLDMSAAPNGHTRTGMNGHAFPPVGEVASTPVLRRHSPSLNGGLTMTGDGRYSSSGLDNPAFLDKHEDSHFLGNLLAEERKRCNQHKENYNQLKQEHRNLQNELLSLQEEVRDLNREKTELVEKHAHECTALESQILSLKSKLSELQGQLPARDRLDALKTQMISEVEGPFRSRLENLEADNESLRADNAKLKHDFTFLKTEYEHTLERHKSTLEDLKLQHEAEVTNLARDKDDLVRRLHQDNSADMDRLRNLQKDNSSLNHKVKSLLTELDEIRSQREKLGLESDHVSRLQSKQMTEFQANVRALEIEKETLRKQVDSQARELSLLVDSQTEVTKRLHEEEQRSASLRNDLEKAKHETSLQLTQSRLEATRSQGVVERERDSLHNQVDDLKARIEAQQMVVQQLEASLREKERDCAERINAIREEEFHKLSQANHDKQNLESRVQVLERQRVELDERAHKDQLRHEQVLRDSQLGKEQLEKEVNSLRAKINGQTQLQSELDYERSRSGDMKNQLMKLEAENSALRNTETELTELIGNLRVKLTANNEELRRSKMQETTHHNTADKVLAQHKAVWADEKQELRKRIEQLDSKLQETKQALDKATSEHSKKKEVYSRLVEKLRRKIEIGDAEKKELQIQVESVRGFVPPDVVNQLRRELKELKARHKEYKHIMLSGDITHVPIGDKSFASASVHNANFDISPNRSHESPDLHSLINRLDKLSETQRKQKTEYGVTSSVPSPVDSSLVEEEASL